jgi:hypothetical protein
MPIVTARAAYALRHGGGLRGHCLPAPVCYQRKQHSEGQPMTETPAALRVRDILASVKPLAAEYYRLTGKPMGVTGEVAEYVAADVLGLELAPPRMAGYDAIRRTSEGSERIQIKGRALAVNAKAGQRMSRIKLQADCDVVMLVLLDNASLDLREIWEAPYDAVTILLSRPGSKARERGSLGITEFKRLAKQIWPVANLT